MAIGDDAAAAGYPLVPSSGEEGKVKWGYREINRTRDFVAQVKALLPFTKAAARAQAGISSGVDVPSNATGDNDDIFIRTGTDSSNSGVYVKVAGIWQKYTDL